MPETSVSQYVRHTKEGKLVRVSQYRRHYLAEAFDLLEQANGKPPLAAQKGLQGGSHEMTNWPGGRHGPSGMLPPAIPPVKKAAKAPPSPAKKAPSQKRFAVRAEDARKIQGQTAGHFVNHTSGHKMGKTEIGDTYEQMFMAKFANKLTDRYGKISLVTGAGRGTSRTTPLDFASETHGGELKTININTKNQKTAIKAAEIERKVNAIHDRGLKELLLVQVVDQDSGTVHVYGYPQFASKAVSKMEHLGSYQYDQADFERAQEASGHASKAAGRAEAQRRAAAKKAGAVPGLGAVARGRRGAAPAKRGGQPSPSGSGAGGRGTRARPAKKEKRRLAREAPGETRYEGPGKSNKVAVVKDGKVIRLEEKDTGKDVSTHQGLWNWNQKLKQGKLKEVGAGATATQPAPAKKAVKKVEPAKQAGPGVGVPGPGGGPGPQAAPSKEGGGAAGGGNMLPALAPFVIGPGLSSRVIGNEGTTPPADLKRAISDQEARLPGHASMLDHIATYPHGPPGVVAQYLTYTQLQKKGLKGPGIEFYLNTFTQHNADATGTYFVPGGDGSKTIENFAYVTASHEFGHGVYTLLTRRQKAELHRIVAKQLGAHPPPIGDVDSSAGWSKEQKGFNSLLSKYRSQIRKDLSIYGSSKRDEFMAECWAEYSTNPNCRPLARAVGEQMERFAHQNHGEPAEPHGPGMDWKKAPAKKAAPKDMAALAAKIKADNPHHVALLNRLDEITQADVEQGKVPGVEISHDLSVGVAAHAGYGGQNIRLAPTSFRDGRIDSILMSHEAGHKLVPLVIRDGKVPDEMQYYAAGYGKASGIYAGAGYAHLFNSPFKGEPDRPEEMIADAYEALLHGENEFRYDGPPDPEVEAADRAAWEKSPKHLLLNKVAEAAREVGWPDHQLYRITPDLRTVRVSKEAPSVPAKKAAAKQAPIKAPVAKLGGPGDGPGHGFGPAFDGKIKPGDTVYKHPVGSIIVVHPDGSLDKYSASGKPVGKTSATADKLAAGHGQWKKVDAPSGPVTVHGPTKAPGVKPAEANEAVVTTPQPESEVPSAPPPPSSGKPHVPMVFNEAPLSDVPKYIADDKWFFQQKVDGIRSQLVIEGGKKPWFRSKSGDKSASSTSAKTLDPILKLLGDGVPAGGTSYAVDGEALDGKWYVFDLSIGEKDKTPWEERMARADAWVKAMNDAGIHQIVALPTARTKEEKQALFDAVRDNGGEGVMMKRKDAPYDYDRRVNHTLKAKFVSTADVVVTELNPGGKDSVKIGLHDENGNLKPIGTVTKLGKEAKIGKINVGDVIEVAYLYATPDGTVYQPRIVRKRPDKQPKQAVMTQLRKVNKEVLDAGKLNLSGTEEKYLPLKEAPKARAKFRSAQQGGGVHHVGKGVNLSRLEFVDHILALANSTQQAWEDAAKAGMDHLLLVLKNNPAQTVEITLQRPDVQEALHDAGQSGAQAVMDDLQAVWDANGGNPNSPYLTKLLQDAQANGNMFAERMNQILAANDHSAAKQLMLKERYRAAAAGDVAQTRAQAEAALQDLADSGAETVRWTAHLDSKTCPFCLALDGTVVSIGGEFPIPPGLTPYHTLTGPPAHPNCRCELQAGPGGGGPTGPRSLIPWLARWQTG